ncbi:hypothetical protein [Rhizobium sp. BK176]|uniref:hypothetical protein n=1 Tax=Rhizobium sp. BK176 TaxID=2587071 RepID=UPI00216A79D8|nr:hypothetical protein [Rhizobium sp. BK176]MCS4089590.1 hypothetical protein [Rhizobium sp. BK176]
MPKFKMPKPWVATGKGSYSRPLPRGVMVYNPEEECFFLSVNRGTSKVVGDRWGPWRGVLEDEARIAEEMDRLYEQLEASGWTTMAYRDPEGYGRTHEANKPNMVKALAKIPRSPLIPWILRDMLDSDRASRGKAVSGGVLRAAGHDFHVEYFGRMWDGAPADHIWLTLQNPGQSKRTEGGKRLQMDLHQVDAMLDFLIGVRENLAPKETADAITHEFRVGQPGEDNATRLLRMRQHAQGMNAVLEELKESSPEQLATILAMTRMINAGDMTVELVYGPEDEAGANVH